MIYLTEFELLTLIGKFPQHAPDRLLKNSSAKEVLVDTKHLKNFGGFKDHYKHTSETLTGEKIVF